MDNYVIIRLGKIEDISRIVEMAEQFWSHTDYNDEFESEMVEVLAENCIIQGLMVVLEIEEKVVGFVCGIKGPLLANSKVMTGTEIAWWVEPSHRDQKNGIALLKFIEEKARLQGIKYWNMLYMQSSMPEIVEDIYQKMGYTKTEVSYTKVL